jgi:predicted protein tyrosine phosphatase
MKTKLLFLCSVNIDRSPCAEELFEDSAEYEAKSTGLDPYSNSPLTEQAIEWADIIFVMDERNEKHKSILIKRFPEAESKDIRILNINNDFKRYDEELKRRLIISLEREDIEISLSRRKEAGEE